MYISQFGKIIKDERKAWGMSRRRLARLSFCTAEDVEKIETGVIDNPSFYLILNICETLDISIFYLLSETGRTKFEVGDYK